MKNRSKWSLIGIPDHQGVVHVRGRLGAARGPQAFREAFKKLHWPLNAPGDSIEDLGDVPNLANSVSRNIEAAADFIATHHSDRTIVVGGGHDHGYSHLLGVQRAMGKSGVRLGCINIDAHLDLRSFEPVITSGSPFRLCIEKGVLHPERLIEFGIQPQANSPELHAYATKKKITVIEMARLRWGRALPEFAKALGRLKNNSDAIVISLDLDSVAAAFAPGVSAPQAEGFTPSEIFSMIEHAAREPKVVSLGIFELNPEHDESGRTALLAAGAAFHFISGNRRVKRRS